MNSTTPENAAAVEPMVSPVLCYVEGCWAFFTTQPLEKQWGDDWNDAPYEHNAGWPYGPSQSAFTTRENAKDRRIVRVTKQGKTPEKDWVEFSEYDETGRPGWEIVKVSWDGDFETPSDGHTNSPFSVEQINAGAIAWLRTSRRSSGPQIIIPAGTTLDRFKELIKAGGGHVYVRD